MGLLDDAIRQHLELKRQHGAPEDEIERQEEEALGPARRDVAPAEPSGGDGEVELESMDEPAAADAASEQETELFEPEESEPTPEQPEAALDETALHEPETAPPGGPDTPFEPETAPPGGPDTPFEPETASSAEPDMPFEPESPPSAGPDVPFEPGEDPESEPEGIPRPDAVPPSPAPFDADTAFEELSERGAPDDEDEEPEGGSEQARDESDVLEDTPDFLQETPEHDRLWFEQKPPRDFDFD